MRVFRYSLLAFLVTATLVALLSLLQSYATQTTFLVALHQVLVDFMNKGWEFLVQPAVAAIIAIFILLRLGLPSVGGLLGMLEELSASIGPLSVKGKLDASRLLTEPEVDGIAHEVAELEPRGQTIEDVVSNLDFKITKLLVDLANRKVRESDMVSMVTTILHGDNRKDDISKTASLAWSAGILRSLRGTLLQISRESIDDDYEITVTISRPTLDLLYERLKQLGLEDAPDAG